MQTPLDTSPASSLETPTEMTVYQAPAGFLNDLLAELALAGITPRAVREPLVLVDGPPLPLAWVQNVWPRAVFLPAPSIGQAAKALKALGRNWAALPLDHFRRTALIQEKLPKVSARPLSFGQPKPGAPLGAWTLWEEDTILASAAATSPFARGEARFEEDRTGPPNRAYLKIWEALTLLGHGLGHGPGPGDLCLDLGGSPGGWAYVLAGLGSRVFCVDKAPLDAAVAALPNVEYCRGSAFSLEPAWTGPVDWFFSDVICYPARLLTLVRAYLDAKACANFVVTLKFQAATDHEAAQAFAAIPGARLVHLFHNKHELTFLLTGPKPALFPAD